MKEIWKKKIKILWRKFLTSFALYALLPLVCGGIVGLLFLFRKLGGGVDGEQLLYALGDKTVMTAVGSEIFREEKEDTVFYFLTPEVLPPLRDGIVQVVGNAHYFSTVEIKQEEEKQEEEKKKAEVMYESLPADAKPVIRCDLSSDSYYINTTNYTIDLKEARAAPFPSSVTTNGSEPLVLILHTHGTECYFHDNTNLSDFAKGEIESFLLEKNTSFRSSDPKKGVIQVGKVFSETLNSLGIPTMHCTTMHDLNDFNQAYVESAETVKQILKEHPSIQYVIDIHRDSVVRGDSYVKSFATIDGKDSAQVMLVVGTNQNGRHPNWKQNLTVATAFKDSLDSLFPQLSRSLYLRTSRFNQEFLPGAMLLEVGSAANTLEEAENAARFAAKAFFAMLQEKQ